MKVLIVETTLFGYDGITSVITNYYRYQDHNRVQMNLVTINPVSESFLKELSQHNSRNIVLPYRNANPVKYVHKLAEILRKGKYDIIHVHGCSSTMAVEMLAGKLAGVKIRISHSHNTKCDHVKADKILRPFFNRWCNVGFACSKEAGQWLFPQKEFSVISNGVDLEKFQFQPSVREEMRKRYGLEHNFVVGHVGRFSLQKNHRKLIEIFAEISRQHENAKLVLVGDGELKEEIQELAEKQHLDVLFAGLSNEVEKWLQAMDVMVFPSLFEGLPLGMVEAQASGLPCVLSNTVSHDAKLTDLVAFVDLEAEASVWAETTDRMYRAIDRPTHVESVKTQIRRVHFDIRSNCGELADKYEMLLNNKEI